MGASILGTLHIAVGIAVTALIVIARAVGAVGRRRSHRCCPDRCCPDCCSAIRIIPPTISCATIDPAAIGCPAIGHATPRYSPQLPVGGD